MAACGFWGVVGYVQPLAFRPKVDGPTASQGKGQCTTPDAAKAALRTLSWRLISCKKAD